MADSQLPLELPVQPGIGAATFESAQGATTRIYTNRDHEHDDGRDHGRSGKGDGQRNAQNETYPSRYANADPKFISSQAAHNDGVVIEPVGQECHRPIRANILISHVTEPR